MNTIIKKIAKELPEKAKLLVHKNHVEQIIDGAIADANKFGIGKLFARLKKKTEEGYKILTEKNFAE